MVSVILVEHTLYVASDIQTILKCEPGKDTLLAHVNRHVPFLYRNANHISILEAICVKNIGHVVTFVSVYIDVFIMTIGTGLSSQFKLFNEELKRTKREVNTIYILIIF